MGMLIEFVLLVAVIALVAVLVFQVNDDTRTELVADNLKASCGLNSTGGTSGTILYTACGVGYNATIDADTAIAKIPKNLKILATAVVFSVIIFVIVRVIPMGNVSGTGGSF